MPSFDVVVIGGGIVGCAIAHRLARRGIGTLLLERSVPGAEASSVAGGILAPRIEHDPLGIAARLGVASLARHAELAQELRAEHGIDVGFRRSGGMIVALYDDPEGEVELAARAAHLREAGDRHEWLDASEACRREPALSPATRAAIDLPEEAQVEPPLLLRALAIAAERAGARIRTGAVVRAVRIEGDRTRGVQVDDETISAAHVVVAAGAWTPLVPGLPRCAAQVRPVRGQLVHAETRAPIARRILFGAGGYVLPRPDGRLVCGATMEDEGYRKQITIGGVADVLARALRLVPALAHATLVGHAVSFRPASPDELPLVGRAGPEGLWLATGHHRNGILLAPITADIIADLLEGRAPFPEHAALDPRRFDARA